MEAKRGLVRKQAPVRWMLVGGRFLLGPCAADEAAYVDETKGEFDTNPGLNAAFFDELDEDDDFETIDFD